MLDRVGNPEDRFSHNEAQIVKMEFVSCIRPILAIIRQSEISFDLGILYLRGYIHTDIRWPFTGLRTTGPLICFCSEMANQIYTSQTTVLCCERGRISSRNTLKLFMCFVGTICRASFMQLKKVKLTCNYSMKADLYFKYHFFQLQ